MTQASFSLTERQGEALRLIGSLAVYVMLFGGSRSGKTFLAVRSIVIRALASPGSRHAILRFRFNHVKASIVRDTFPKVMAICFPDIKYHVDKTDWFATLPNGAEIWFGGLDDKERTEKILGLEFATIYLNECSQIAYSSFLLMITRLAQVCYYEKDGKEKELRLLMLFDCNPPSQAHWTYKVFIKKTDPMSKKSLPNAGEYASIMMNPKDNSDNLSPAYLQQLQNLPKRMKDRFWAGKFADITENALFNAESIDKWRQEDHPDLQRIVVAVDPSGAGDDDNADNDAIGIIVGGLGVDGNAYILEDVTVKAGPKVWGNVVATAYGRHLADLVVGEVNYGGEMVKFVVQAADPKIPFKKITSSRGKVLRAEPISSLVEQGKVRFVGQFNDLEDELCSFTTAGYLGELSPNRADAFVFVVTELFPGVVRQKKKAKKKESSKSHYSGAGAWMG